MMSSPWKLQSFTACGLLSFVTVPQSYSAAFGEQMHHVVIRTGHMEVGVGCMNHSVQGCSIIPEKVQYQYFDNKTIVLR